MRQIDGGWDVLQLGFTILLADVVFELQGDDLILGIRQFDEAGNAVALSEMDDVITIQDWGNEMSRVEELRFGDGLAIDISGFEGFQSGLGANYALTGGEGSDLLTGGGGNDSLVGGDGDDLLEGGGGNDDLFGGADNDTLRGGDGDDYLLAGDGDDVLEGGDGDDVLIVGRGDDILRGGLGNDTYIFNRGDGHDTIDESLFSITEGGTTSTETGIQDFVPETQTQSFGGKWPYATETNVWVSETRTGAIIEALEGGDDVLQFGAFIDIGDLIVQTVESGSNENLLVELEPLSEDGMITDSITIETWNAEEFRIETFRFANGFVLDVSDVGAATTGDDGDNALSAAGMSLDGGDGAWLAGGDGDDTLTGSDQNDILIGGVGSDRLEGGGGDDIYVFSRGDGLDLISDSGSSAVGNDRSNPGGDKLLFDAGITIEDLILYRDGDDLKIFVSDQASISTPLNALEDGITIENWASGDNRIELLQFFNGLDFDISQIENTSLGADVLDGGTESPANDTLDGSNAADWIDGFAGHDVLNGLDGDDFIFGREGNDTLNGGAGDDIMTGGADDDVLNGGAGNDIMTGGADDDVLSGNAGDDILMGGTGDDTLNGGVGNDLLVGDLGDDMIIASAGQDIIRFGIGDGNDTYVGDTAYANTDVFVFEAGIEAEDIWFERIENSLIVRIHGSDDTFTFENWFYGQWVSAYVQGFSAGAEWLSHEQVNDLVAVMSDQIANLNDGTTAYGILPGQTPDEILAAIDAAWV
jgi:Ca2+-binding RTX toxin-like protein